METEYRNNLTKEMDKYRIKYDIMDVDAYYSKFFTTYLWYPDIVNKESNIAFRLPGATRGHIEVDKDYKILDIIFYEDTCFNKRNNGIQCYTQEVFKVKDTFIGTILDIHNGIIGDDYLYE